MGRIDEAYFLEPAAVDRHIARHAAGIGELLAAAAVDDRATGAAARLDQLLAAAVDRGGERGAVDPINAPVILHSADYAARVHGQNPAGQHRAAVDDLAS